MVSAYFFFKVFNVKTSAVSLILLGTTVWLIYTIDHLLDVKKLKKKASTERHQFHQDNFKILVKITISILLVNLSLLFFLPQELIFSGSALALVVLIYLLFNKYLRSFKEIVVAIFYTWGVSLPVLSQLKDPINSHQQLLLIHFSITALMNLILFSIMERKSDLKDNTFSFAVIKGEAQTKFFFLLLVIIAVGIFLSQLRLNQNFAYEIILLSMNIVLGVLFVFRNQSLIKRYYRLIGDGVFLLPLASVLSF